MQALAWLPPGCFASRRAAEPFARVLDGWSREWLRGEPWQVLGSWETGGPPHGSSFSLLRESGRVRLEGKARALHHLALAMLGLRDHDGFTEQDLRLMRRAAGEALDDLQARLDQVLARDPGRAAALPGADGGTHSLLIGTLGEAWLALECTTADLVATIRAGYAATAPGDRLEAPARAYADREIAVGALIGSASVTLGDIAALEIGDVIVLDRPLAEGAALLVETRPTPLALSLGETAGRVTLTVMDA